MSSAWVSGAMQGAAQGGSMAGGWGALIGAVAGGVGSYLSDSSERKAAEEDRKHDLGLVRARGDEERRNYLYKGLLDDYYGQLGKYRKNRALSNTVGYARANPGRLQSVNKLAAYDSPIKIQNPGSAPSPMPLFGQPEGSSSRGWKPLYTLDENNNLSQAKKPKG